MMKQKRYTDETFRIRYSLAYITVVNLINVSILYYLYKGYHFLLFRQSTQLYCNLAPNKPDQQIMSAMVHQAAE